MYLSSRINHLRLRSEQLPVPPSEGSLLEHVARSILNSPLTVLAIDFDKTLIDDDSGSSMNFRNIYIRNQFFWLLKHLIRHRWICITSFNGNTPTPFNENLGIVTQTVVRRLLNLTDRYVSRHSIDQRLAREYRIIIQSYPSRSYGKLEHIQNCIDQIQAMSPSPMDIQPYQIGLLDDHPINIKEAEKYYPAALIPVHEFNRKSQSIEPMIALVDRLLAQSWSEYKKSKSKRRFSQGDRERRSSR